MKKQDLLGKQYGRLTVVREAPPKNGGRKVTCLCTCGTETTVFASNLVRGTTTSCGCLSRERSTTHGFSGHPLYRIWGDMVNRCRNVGHPRYKDYGGRGIRVCELWEYDAGAFIQWALSHGYDKALQLDRTDNDGGYGPENCRFVTAAVNVRNQRPRGKIKVRGIGVKGKTFTARVGVGASRVWLGAYPTVPEAEAAITQYRSINKC